MHRSGRLSLASLFALALLAGGLRAQETEKPDAPRPKDVPKPNGGVIQALATYHPLTGKERVRWVVEQTFGPESLFVGALKTGLATADNSPEEYGPHWDGFGKRYGMRFTGIAASNTMEAGLGAIWGEDPRYVRNETLPFKGRIRNVIVLAFAARNREGRLKPAYARYVAVPGNNFLSNAWRVDSEATNTEALTRTAYGFLGKIGGNAWSEFWPDIKQRIFKR